MSKHAEITQSVYSYMSAWEFPDKSMGAIKSISCYDSNLGSSFYENENFID